MSDVTVNNFDFLRNNFILKAIIGILLLIYFGLTGIYAQEALITAGGNASGSGGSISYSVGQVVYTTNTGANGSGAQGVQQPYEISGIEIVNQANFMKGAKISNTGTSSSEITNIEDSKLINQKCNVYPNPTTNIITLAIEYFVTENDNLSFQLFDINGKLIENKKVENSRTHISMGNLVAASYLLNVIQGNKSIKIFKIIKN